MGTNFTVFAEVLASQNIIYLNYQYIDGLEQERRNSNASAKELRFSCTNPSIDRVDYIIRQVLFKLFWIIHEFE